MYTRTQAQLDASRLIANIKAVGETRMGFLGLLDDKGYVPAEPKVETSLEKTVKAVIASIFSAAYEVRTGYDWLMEPEFDFLDFLASKGHVPAFATADAPVRKEANDNWPLSGRPAAPQGDVAA